MSTAKGSPWYPNASQIGTPQALQTTFKRVLDQLYSLANRVTAGGGSAPAKAAPKSSAAISTTLLGLTVEPVDVSTLADGATLKFVKASGTLRFS